MNMVTIESDSWYWVLSLFNDKKRNVLFKSEVNNSFYILLVTDSIYKKNNVWFILCRDVVYLGFVSPYASVDIFPVGILAQEKKLAEHKTFCEI